MVENERCHICNSEITGDSARVLSRTGMKYFCYDKTRSNCYTRYLNGVGREN